MSYQWSSDKYACIRKSKSKVQLTREKTEKHPLENVNPKLTKVKTDILEGLDPLSINELDPLTRMAADLDPFASTAILSRSSRDTFEPWASKKIAILNKFTTQEKLSITTSSFASEHEVRGVSEKVLHRLEQLDLDTGSRQFFGGLTQEEYTSKINQLDQQLTQAWQADLRVNALKISIQCCKLLGDTSVISFYPSKFVIITDILDKFGEMVFNRLKGKQSDILPAEVAKETCKNWFFKVGSIRELLPRLSIELAILKSYSFIHSNPDYGRTLSRLLSSMWGIGDPIVAIYLRCYLCRVAMELVPNHKELYMQCFQDLLLLHDQVLDNFRHSPQLAEAKVTMDTYMTVLSPAVDWILQCLVHRGEHLNYTMQLVSNVPPFWKSVLMSSVLSTFPPSFIGDECVGILDTILTLETNLGDILRNLGLCLIIVEPQHHQAKEIWNRVWPYIRKIQNRDSYLNCCEVWVEFMVKYFTTDVVNNFLEDIIEHITYRNAESFHGKLTNIIEKLLTYSLDISYLLHMDKFVKIVTMLNVDTVKNILIAFNNKHANPQGDNIVINTLMHFASILHDSVDALTPIDEIKQIGGLINGLILKVNYGRDFEKQLQFYDEARGAFTNIDIVLIQLVQCVCRLGMEIYCLVDGHHTKRTKAFLSACIAYSFITIPSLDSCYSQIQLYLLTSQVSYCNQCISQGDACLKAAILLLSENMAEIECGEHLLIDYVCNLLSTLLAVPDHPKESMLYLLKALMTIEWSSPILSLKFLSLLGAFSQQKYPYGFSGVDANDSLYGGDEKFVAEVNSTASSILNDILLSIKSYGDQGQLKKQGTLSLELFFQIIIWADIKQMGNLTVNLWNLAKKNGDAKIIIKSLESIKRKAAVTQDFQILASKISSP